MVYWQRIMGPSCWPVQCSIRINHNLRWISCAACCGFQLALDDQPLIMQIKRCTVHNMHNMHLTVNFAYCTLHLHLHLHIAHIRMSQPHNEHPKTQCCSSNRFNYIPNASDGGLQCITGGHNAASHHGMAWQFILFVPHS